MAHILAKLDGFVPCYTYTPTAPSLPFLQLTGLPTSGPGVLYMFPHLVLT